MRIPLHTVARLWVVLLSFITLMACTKPEPLAIGLHPWPGYESLYLAETFGWLPEGVRLHRSANASGTLDALRAGDLDGAALTLDEVLTARSERIPLTVIMIMNISVGSDVVLARPEIESFADLRGRNIAVEHSAVGEIVLSQLLQAADLSRDEVNVLDIPPNQQSAAWRDQLIDVAVSYYPSAALLERQGAVTLLDSRAFPSLIFDVLAVRQDRLRGRSSLITDLVAAHFQGLQHIQTNREDALRRIAAWRNFQVNEIAQSFAGLELPSVAGNRHLLAPQGELLRAARQLNELMVTIGLLAQADSLNHLVDQRYLPRDTRQ